MFTQNVIWVVSLLGSEANGGRHSLTGIGLFHKWQRGPCHVGVVISSHGLLIAILGEVGVLWSEGDLLDFDMRTGHIEQVAQGELHWRMRVTASSCP